MTSSTEVGFVVEAKQYVLTIEGLPSVQVGDIIEREGGGRAIVRSLDGERVTALKLDWGASRAGERWSGIPQQKLYSLGDHLFGRTIDVLGEPIDGKEPLPQGNEALALDVDAPGIDVRLPITEPLHTGIILVDSLLPLAKGQRQLLFGPVQGGKTDFLIDTILNQASYGTICIYAIIGKPLSELERIESAILKEGHGKNIIIAALSDQPSPRIWLAPSVAFMVADFFQRQGRDVLVVLDDLDVHAKYLREIALLENRLPGRESYPGDLFYQHAHLMERCGHYTKEAGGGTITALPVISTDPDTSLGIVSTNLMSSTDGHWAFLMSLQGEGVYPAISEERSITRIGRNAQKLLPKQLSVEIRLRLAESRRQRGYSQFGAVVSKTVEATLHQGDIIEAMLQQSVGERMEASVQIPLLALTLTPLLLAKDAAFVKQNKRRLAEGIASDPELRELVDLSLSDLSLSAYLKKIDAKRAPLEKLCRA